MTSPITERAARAIFPSLAKLADFNAEGIGQYDDPDESHLREESIRIAEMVLEAVSPPPMTGVLHHNKVGIGGVFIDCSQANWHGDFSSVNASQHGLSWRISPAKTD